MIETNAGYNPQDQLKNDNGKSEVSLALIQGVVQSLDQYIARHYEGSQTLRPKQMTVFEAIRNSFKKGETEGYVDAPTGFGKTVLFGQVVAATDTMTTIVVPTKRLVEQTYKKLKFFNPELSVGRVYDKRKEYGKQVTVTTYASLVLTSGNEDELRNREKTNLVIFDEMQEAVSERRIRSGETFENALILGFSATPVRVEDERVVDMRVTKMTQNEIFKIPLREAVEEGYISPFSAYIIEVDADISKARITSKGNFDDEDLEKILNTKAANKAAVDFFLQLREIYRKSQLDGGRTKPDPFTTSVYVTSIAHARDLAKEYREAGVNAAAVWGQQDLNEQNEIMRQLENGEMEVVCSKDLLVRGIDVPNIRFVLNVAPTTSSTVEKQRGGRGLRLYESDPDKHTIIGDFVYKNSKKRAVQVTFAQVAEGAQMVRKNVDDDTVHLPKSAKFINVIPNDIRIEGLKVITSSEEVMKIVRKMIEFKNQRDPLEGWMTTNEMSQVLGITFQAASGLIEKHRGSNPDWINTTEGENQKRQRISPELFNLIKSEVRAQTVAPEGWMTRRQAEGLGLTRDAIDRFIEQKRKSNPEDFQIFQNKKNTPREYMAPSLIAKLVLQERTKKLQQTMAPNGWRPIRDVTKELGITRSTLFQRTQDISSDNEEFIREYFDPVTKKLMKYMQADVIEKIKIKTPIKGSVPEGWMTFSKMAEYLGVSRQTLRRRLSELPAVELPETQIYKDSVGKNIKHYSIEFAEKLRELTSKYI